MASYPLQLFTFALSSVVPLSCLGNQLPGPTVEAICHRKRQTSSFSQDYSIGLVPFQRRLVSKLEVNFIHLGPFTLLLFALRKRAISQVAEPTVVRRQLFAPLLVFEVTGTWEGAPFEHSFLGCSEIAATLPFDFVIGLPGAGDFWQRKRGGNFISHSVKGLVSYRGRLCA